MDAGRATAHRERYTIISADTHAGASHATYRDYLEAAWHEEFDAWRSRYRNPFHDLKDTSGRTRNWDSARRWREQEADGVVAEVVFPNTVPPFFPSFVLFAPPPTPEDYERRLAGIRAHNRWMADFVSERPQRRAGLGQVFLNDVDDAIRDVRWIAENGLRGGVLINAVPPDVDWVRPLYHPDFDPLWEVCADLGVPVTSHGGSGTPDYGALPVAPLLRHLEAPFYSQRPFLHLLMSGVFERFQRLRFVMTEQGCAWLPPLLTRLDSVLERMRATGAVGENRFAPGLVLPRSASDYFSSNCWVGISQPGPADAAARHVLDAGRLMWGSDYPHDEGTYPYTREHLRQIFHDAEPAELDALLCDNAASLYGFDRAVLDPVADRVGPTVEEIAQPLTHLPDAPNEALRKGALRAG